VDQGSHDVALSIPASAGYLVLARLALSAVCRLTPLEAVEVADFKLAITEAANEFVEDGEAPSEEERTIAFAFQLAEDRLVVTLVGSATAAPAAEQELSRAIIEATVDESQFAPGRATLTKRL
jgi:anti-sigma regulatory factor (Ser/Thr protein kinase)